MRIFLYAFAFLIFFSSKCFSANKSNILILDESISQIDIWPYISLYIDETAELGIREVKNLQFNHKKKDKPSYPISKYAYWLKFDVINRSNQKEDWLFEVDYPTLTDVQAFIFKDQLLVKKQLTGINHYSKADFKYRNPLFLSSLESNEIYTVFVRIDTNSSMQIPVYAFSFQGFFDQDLKERNLLMLMMGIIIFSIILNFTLFFVNREWMYIYLGMSLLFIELHLFFLTGFINEINHFISPDYVERIRNIGYTVSIALVFLFALIFLEVKKYSNFLYITFQYIIGIFIFYTIATASPFISFRFLNALSGIIYLIGICILITGSVYIMRQGHSTAKYFVIATSVFLVSGLVFNAYFSGLIQKSFMAQHSLIISCTIFSITLTAGLTENIASKKREKLRLENLSTQNELLEREIGTRSEIEEELRQHKENLQELVEIKSRALLDSEREYSYIVENLHDWIWQVDRNGNFTFNSPGVENVIGYTAEYLKGKSYKTLFTDKKVEKVKTLLEQDVPTITGLSDIELTCMTKEGTLAFLEVRCVLIMDSEDEVKGLRGIARNISEKVYMKRKILRAVIETEEKERNRFAIELHDGLGATLSGINMYLNTIISEELDEKVKNDLIIKSHDLVKQVAASVREIASDIRPYVLTEFGLVASIESLCERLSTTGEITIDLKTSKLEKKIDKDNELVLFRILSELLNNTIKHAKATKIDIDLFNVESKIFLIYQDNGIGFDYGLYSLNEEKGMGVQNIITRVSSIGGTYEISTKPGKGFKAFIEISI